MDGIKTGGQIRNRLLKLTGCDPEELKVIFLKIRGIKILKANSPIRELCVKVNNVEDYDELTEKEIIKFIKKS